MGNDIGWLGGVTKCGGGRGGWGTSVTMTGGIFAQLLSRTHLSQTATTCWARQQREHSGWCGHSGRTGSGSHRGNIWPSPEVGQRGKTLTMRCLQCLQCHVEALFISALVCVTPVPRVNFGPVHSLSVLWKVSSGATSLLIWGQIPLSVESYS